MLRFFLKAPYDFIEDTQNNRKIAFVNRKNQKISLYFMEQIWTLIYG